MRPEELTELLRVRPFSPVRFHLTGGETFNISHPDQVIVQRQRVDGGVGAHPDTGVVEQVEHISMLHVVRVKHMPPAGSGTA